MYIIILVISDQFKELERQLVKVSEEEGKKVPINE